MIIFRAESSINIIDNKITDNTIRKIINVKKKMGRTKNGALKHLALIGIS